MRVRIAAAKAPARPAPPKLPHLKRERALWRSGTVPVAGVDEAGRGPLAGPVVAAAVILDPERVPEGINDSKVLSGERREQLFEAILASCEVSVASVSASRIDAVNIRVASFEAMRRAIAGLVRRPAFAFVDGRDLPPLPCPGEAVIDGDAIVLSVAAASIVAKVTRDRMMTRLCATFPAYGFSSHAGYATAAHRRALAEHGPCPYHRMSFSPIRPEADAAE
jgi:ribonuclease HII